MLTGQLLHLLQELLIRKDIPLWAADPFSTACKVVPLIICIPLIFAAAGNPIRIAALTTNTLPAFEHVKLFWHSIVRASVAYTYIWSILPWYLIPLLALVMTERLLPYYVPVEYEATFNIFIFLVSAISLYRIIPLIMTPLAAVLGSYDQYRAYFLAREALKIERTSLSLILIMIAASFYGVIYLSPDGIELSIQISVLVMITIYLLSVASAVLVPALTALEQRGL